MNKIKREIIASAVGQIVKTEQDSVKRYYRFGPDFIGFSGHFPGNPILPAFVQILTGLTLAEEHKGCFLELESIEKAKFSIPLYPDQKIEVECRYREEKGRYICDARLSVAEGLASSFRITFDASGSRQ